MTLTLAKNAIPKWERKSILTFTTRRHVLILILALGCIRSRLVRHLGSIFGTIQGGRSVTSSRDFCRGRIGSRQCLFTEYSPDIGLHRKLGNLRAEASHTLVRFTSHLIGMTMVAHHHWCASFNKSMTWLMWPLEGLTMGHTCTNTLGGATKVYGVI
jgi:hypothetical protein